MIITFEPWRPDLGETAGGGNIEATGVVPGINAYEPQPALRAATNSLSARCQGAFAAQDSDGGVSWIAGDNNKLYAINATTVTWSNVSRASLYTTSADGSWSFAQYGDNLFAANRHNELQVYTLGANGIFSDVGNTAPKARWLGVVKNFLVAANTSDSSGVITQRVRWSGIDAPLSWTVDTTTQADFQDLYGGGGDNQGVAVALSAADAVIFQERSVWRMTYVGVPRVFEFDLVEGIRGTPAPGSIIVVGGICYYLGEDGFYAFDGAQSLPIGHGKIDRTFFADADDAYFRRISAAADIDRKLILWSYASGDAAGGVPDKVLVYNVATGEWSRLEVSTEVLWRTLAFGYTLEDLDAVDSNIDTFPVSFDSRQWRGGAYQLSAFDADHSAAHFNGGNMAAVLTTRTTTLADPRRMMVTEVRPLLQCNSATADVAVSIGHRRTPSDSVTFETSTLMNDVGFCPQRVSDHFLRYRMSVSSSVEWSRAFGLDVTIKDNRTWR